LPKKNEDAQPVEELSVQEAKPKSKPTEDKLEAAPEAKVEKTKSQPVEVASDLPVGDLVTPLTTKRPLRLSKDMAIKVGAVVLALVALFVLAFGVLIYGYRSESRAVELVSAVIPYPVQRVNSSFVLYNDYLFEVDANKRAYQNNAKLNGQPAVDFTKAEGKKMLTEIHKHALDKLKSDAVVAQLARQKKVTVSEKEVNDLVNDLYSRYGGKETLMKTLKQIYSWDLADLRRVVRKQLLAQKLQEKVTTDPATEAIAKAKAQDVLGKIKQGGDFAAIAKQYSQASDASAGGELGSFTRGQLPDELQKAVDALQPGQVSDLVKTKYGFEIIKVTEKSGDTAKASHILIETVDYDQYFQEQLDKAKTQTFIKVA
jgi:parvulin-like peptidyl-prolyl isomerase